MMTIHIPPRVAAHVRTAAALILAAGGTALHAQATVPSLTISGVQTPGIPVSAAEAAYHVGRQELLAESARILDADYPHDSVLAIGLRTANTWLVPLQSGTVKGIQLDPAGHVHVAAGQEANAQQQIATRLATPGLSFNDRAYTYMSAALAFMSPDFPERLPIAERYVAALDSMGNNAAFWRYSTHAGMAHEYYALGRPADVIRHGMMEVALAGQLEYYDRLVAFSPQGGRAYAEIVDALSGQPNAHSRIDSVNAILKRATAASAADLAWNPDYTWRQQDYEQMLKGMMTTSLRIGTKAQNVEGNYWINMPRSDSQTMSLSDGRIHVLDISNYTCTGCLVTMTRLQRVQDKYPAIQIVTATWTTGAWGNRLVSPEYEVEQLRQAYTGHLKIRYPITIWKGNKVVNEDGGLTPADGGPNLAHYPMVGKPNLYVIDGNGIIRRVYISFSPEDEAPMARLIEYLLHEQSGNTRASGFPVSSPSHASPSTTLHPAG